MNKISISLVLVLLIPFAAKACHFATSHSPQKNIYVSTTGNDLADGSLAKPLKSISKAVAKALAGDRILIMDGVYRESVKFEHGGSSESNRISLEALNTGKVTLKGSDQKLNWVKQKDKRWKCMLDAQIPQLMLFLNGKKLINVNGIEDSKTAMGWMRGEEQGKTVLWANFGDTNPNVQLTEIAIRQYAISANGNVDYITIKGINVSQVANGYATIYAEQPGAIYAKNGKYWDILNCTISDCRSVGISIGNPGHVYDEINPGKPEFSDYSDLAQVGHHKIKNNHIFDCGQAGIFGLLGGSSSIIEDNLIENINQDQEYTGAESAGIRLAMAVDVTIKHNLIRKIKGKSSFGVFLGPVFQGARVSRNIITNSDAGLFYLFKSHGPALFDNNILVMATTATSGVAGVNMMASEANVFVQNLFYNCSFNNERQPGKSVSTANFLPHTLVIKQTIPALNIDHRWYGNLFVGKGTGIPKAAGCESDFNFYGNGALAMAGADPNSLKAGKSLVLRLQHNQHGVDLLWESEKPKAIKIPVLTANFLGFFALSKQYVEYPSGEKITVNKDFLNASAGSLTRFAGPFYHKLGTKQKIKLF